MNQMKNANSLYVASTVPNSPSTHLATCCTLMHSLLLLRPPTQLILSHQSLYSYDTINWVGSIAVHIQASIGDVAVRGAFAYAQAIRIVTTVPYWIMYDSDCENARYSQEFNRY
jgi:hypothetical protein